MRPDRIVVGECREGETRFQADHVRLAKLKLGGVLDGGRAAQGRQPRERDHSAAGDRRSVALDPALREGSDHLGRLHQFQVLLAGDGGVPAVLRSLGPEHFDLGRNGVGKNDAVEQPLLLHPGR